MTVKPQPKVKRLLFVCLLFANSAFSQFGAIDLTLQGSNQNCIYDMMTVVLSSTTKTLDTIQTDERGHLVALNLPIGKIHGALIEFGNVIGGFDVEVQNLQLLQAEVMVTPGADYRMTSTGVAVEYVPGTGQPTTISKFDLQNMPTTMTGSVRSTVGGVSSGGELEEIVVVSYRVPLINKDGSSGCTVTRQDLDRLNSQTPFVDYRVPGIVSAPTQLGQTKEMKAGGNYSPELGATPAQITVRGGRVDGNQYYVDGIKVTGNHGVPSSSVESVTVYTGGIPASYGDVTGGVISVRTRSYAMQTVSGGFERCGIRSRAIDPEPTLTADRFPAIYENMFLETRQTPQSTFGIDVDQASWTYVQSSLAQSGKVQRDAVKLEEMINSFDYHLPPVPKDKPMDITFHRMDCPWNTKHQLVAVRLRAMDLPVQEKRAPHNLVFLVDVSGSMSSINKLPLLQDGLIHFVQTLNADDRVSLVTYAGSSGVVLPPTTCDKKETIINAIRALSSGGSTNGIGGIETAYKLALDSFLPGGNNRIILATDGDFNVGINNPSELESYIGAQRGKGVYLTALGFGMGNYRNDILETLADRGDGNHFYIRDINDCRQTLEVNLGNLFNLARDVKLNVEFNPVEVKSYRLIGYENRLMPSEHFRDDTKDGGEIGYGHTVVAVYEIELDSTGRLLENHFDLLKPTYKGDDLCKVSLRYKLLEASSSVEETFHLSKEAPIVENHLLTTVIAFGLEMRQSAYKGTCSKAMLKTMAVKFEGKSTQEGELLKAMNAYLKN